ncbi:CDP-alcohol phosphatidyltransferase family protein [Solwaraspora sp. WMMB335]|uniref:CDP-alcohol phosphatidyltransferase family protein n=1 Tax=Solwaraspora sp. WMMB335 TaxID=3404118 RepID=UPI003B956CA0
MRRSGTFARQVLLVRVGRRPRARHVMTVADGFDAKPVPPRTAAYDMLDHLTRQRLDGLTTDELTTAEIAAIAPISPAVGGPARVSTGDAEAVRDDPAHPAVPLLPGTPTAPRRAGFTLVNATTLTSLTLGLAAIILAMEGDVRHAAFCLIACVVCDGLDGMLARRLGVASPFGAQLDSLADMCSFGLAAPVVVYASLAGTVSTTAAAVACALVAGCAAIRLARFNISPRDGGFFTGVPTTLAAGVLALGVLIEIPVPGTVQLAGVALLAFAMVSSFPYVKLARLLKLPPWLWLVPVVGGLVEMRLTFGLIVLAYLASGPLLWLHRRGAA